MEDLRCGKRPSARSAQITICAAYRNENKPRLILKVNDIDRRCGGWPLGELVRAGGTLRWRGAGDGEGGWGGRDGGWGKVGVGVGRAMGVGEIRVSLSWYHVKIRQMLVTCHSTGPLCER